MKKFSILFLIMSMFVFCSPAIAQATLKYSSPSRNNGGSSNVIRYYSKPANNNRNNSINRNNENKISVEFIDKIRRNHNVQ